MAVGEVLCAASSIRASDHEKMNGAEEGQKIYANRHGVVEKRDGTPLTDLNR